jgi:putative FmdB family regulatory protein
MPTYDYDCASCGRRSEIVHGVYADPPSTCPLCGGGPLRKAMSAPAVHFKGTGWAKKERRPAPSKTGAASGSSGEGSSSEGSSGEGSSGADTSSSDHKKGAGSSGSSGSDNGSKSPKSGGDAGASTATKPASD